MPKKAASFEASITKLEELLAQIADSSTPLEKSIELYAKAAELIDSCNKQLADAHLKIEEINENMQGNDGI